MRDDEHVLTIKDINPKAPVHFLILPKIHVTDMSDPILNKNQIAQPFFEAVQLLAQEYAFGNAFNLISNNGELAGQSVYHMHWHFLAGKNIYDGGLIL